MVKNEVIEKLGDPLLYRSELGCEDCVFNTTPKLEDSCCLVNCTDASESAYAGFGAIAFIIEDPNNLGPEFLIQNLKIADAHQ